MKKRVKSISETSDIRKKQYCFKLDGGQTLNPLFEHCKGEWFLQGKDYAVYSEAELAELLKIVKKLNKE